MIKYFTPDMVLNTVHDLDLNYLKQQGIEGIITDLDNTLVAWNDHQLNDKLKGWFLSLQKAGFKVCILSNNSLSRVEDFASQVGVPAVSKAVKPRRAGFRRALEHLKLQPKQTVVLGDQLFTDILGGNRTGLFTILVTPLSQKEFFGTRIVRQIERILLKKLKEKGLLG